MTQIGHSKATRTMSLISRRSSFMRGGGTLDQTSSRAGSKFLACGSEQNLVDVRTAFALYPAAAGRHDKGLAEGMSVPWVRAPGSKTLAPVARAGLFG
jgi:hypothetical protein